MPTWTRKAAAMGQQDRLQEAGVFSVAAVKLSGDTVMSDTLILAWRRDGEEKEAPAQAQDKPSPASGG